MPKHLLPLSPLNPSCGGGSTEGAATLLQRLLIKTYDSGFEMAIIAIHKDDTQTIPFLLGRSADESKATQNNALCTISSNDPTFNIEKASSFGSDGIITDLDFCGLATSSTSSNDKKISQQSPTKRRMYVRVVRLSEECHGSADALRYLSNNNVSDER